MAVPTWGPGGCPSPVQAKLPELPLPLVVLCCSAVVALAVRNGRRPGRGNSRYTLQRVVHRQRREAEPGCDLGVAGVETPIVLSRPCWRARRVEGASGDHRPSAQLLGDQYLANFLSSIHTFDFSSERVLGIASAAGVTLDCPRDRVWNFAVLMTISRCQRVEAAAEESRRAGSNRRI